MPRLGSFSFGFSVDSRRAQYSLSRVSDSAKRTARSFSQLKAGLAGIIGAQALTGAARLSDEFANAEGRLRLLTDGASEFNRLQAQAKRLAFETRSEFGDTANLISRIGRSASELDATLGDVVTASKAIQQSFRVGGSSAAEAASSATQLSQALSSGQLSGDELRSILENNAVLAQAIAREFNVSVGELKEFGRQGEMTSKRVFKAILRDAENINRQFEQLPKTFSDSGNLIRTSIGQVASDFNRVVGLSDSLFESSKGVATALQGAARAQLAETIGAAKTLAEGLSAAIGEALSGIKQIAATQGIDLSDLFNAPAFLTDIKEAQIFTRALALRFREVKAEASVAFATIAQGLDAFRDPVSDEQLNKLRELIAAQERVLESSSLDGTDLREGVEINLKSLRDELSALLERKQATDTLVIAEQKLLAVRRENAELNRSAVGGSAAVDRIREETEAFRQASDSLTESVNQTVAATETLADKFTPGKTAKEIAEAGKNELEAVKNIGSAAKNEFALLENASVSVRSVAASSFGQLFSDLSAGSANAAKNFADAWIAEIKRLITSQAVALLVRLLLGGGTGGSGRSGSFLSGLFGGGGGGGFSNFKTGAKFRNGGEFRVGGNGGPDSQRVSFLASPNETVSIRTPSQQRSGGGGDVIVQQTIDLRGSEVSEARLQRALSQSKAETVAAVKGLASKGRL